MGVGAMKYMAQVLAIAVVALLAPFPLAHKQDGPCSLGVTNRCSVIVAQADCRDLCMQRLAECRAVKGPNCQAEFALCTSSCR
jgi:hypothetical protein